MPFKHNLNRLLRDAVTGLVGHCTARSEHIDGPNQYRIERNDHTGRPIAEWFTESRLHDLGPSVGGNPEMTIIEAGEREDAERQEEERRKAAETSQDRPLPESGIAPSTLAGLPINDGAPPVAPAADADTNQA